MPNINDEIINYTMSQYFMCITFNIQRNISILKINLYHK